MDCSVAPTIGWLSPIEHPSTRHLPSRAARDFLPSINASQVTRGRLMSGHDFRPGAVPQFFRAHANVSGQSGRSLSRRYRTADCGLMPVQWADILTPSPGSIDDIRMQNAGDRMCLISTRIERSPGGKWGESGAMNPFLRSRTAPLPIPSLLRGKQECPLTGQMRVRNWVYPHGENRCG